MLQPSLAAYEQERVDGPRRRPRGLPGRRRGAAACRGARTAAWTLPARARGRALAALERGDLSRDVLDTQGEQVTHALRARVFPHAENVCAVWGHARGALQEGDVGTTGRAHIPTRAGQMRVNRS